MKRVTGATGGKGGNGAKGGARPEKPCVACGRPFAWRKKWERDWENVRYCSERCRREGPAPAGR